MRSAEQEGEIGSMDERIETVGDVVKVSIAGHLVAACSEEFRTRMCEQLSEARRVLLDLTGMTHIDSSGLGALVSFQQWLNSRGGTLKMACLQARPKVVFDITRVNRIFSIYDTVEAALAAFEAGN